MIDLDELGDRAGNHPPVSPTPIKELQRRADGRSRVRRITQGVLATVGAIVIVLGTRSALVSNSVIVVADGNPNNGDPEEVTTTGPFFDPSSIPESLQELFAKYRRQLPVHTNQTALEQLPFAFEPSDVVVLTDVVPGLDLAAILSPDRREVCMLEVTETGTASGCTSVDDFATHGLATHLSDRFANINHTIVWLPGDTTIGEAPGAEIHAGGLVLVFPQQVVSEFVFIDNGVVNLRFEGLVDVESGSDTRTTANTVPPGQVFQSDETDNSCEYQLRVYNAGTSGGTATKFTDGITDFIGPDLRLWIGPLDAANAEIWAGELAVLIGPEAECADLGRLGLRANATVHVGPISEQWAKLGLDDPGIETSPGSVHIILGTEFESD